MNRNTALATLVIVGLLIGVLYMAAYSLKSDFAPPIESSSNEAVLSKSEETLRARNSGVTAQKVAGNSAKWEGSYVRFPCKISNVVDAGDGSSGANAECGQAVTETLDTDTPNFAYSDPDGLVRAEKEMQSRTNASLKKMEDSGILFLVGGKASALDGGQIVTITGQVIAPSQGTNAMGASMSFPTVRIDYAE